MCNYLYLVILFLLSQGVVAQHPAYSAYLMFGHRSITSMNSVNYQWEKGMKLNHLSLFDTEYQSDDLNIFFIRNMVSYPILKKFSINAAHGMKNPGSFYHVSAQFRTNALNYAFSYSLGLTHQKDCTLEQSIAFELYPQLSQRLRAYFSVLAIANVKRDEYQRGLQYIQLGLRRERLFFGAAFHADQFNNAKKKLFNIGAFIKHNF